MAWTIEFDRSAARELDRLDSDAARRILRFLRDRISPLDDPCVIGAALKGSRFENLWNYRVGDFRVIAAIEHDAVRVPVVRIGHRREVYR